jgi:hypothetical protein
MAEGFGHHPYAELRGDDSRGPSPENSRPSSRSRERPHVRFTPGAESLDSSNQRPAFGLRGHSNDRQVPSIHRSANEVSDSNVGGGTGLSFSSRLGQGIPGDISESLLSRPRNSFSSDIPEEGSDDEKSYQQRFAQVRADRVVGTHSAPNSTRTSPTLHALTRTPSGNTGESPGTVDDIPLVDLSKRGLDESDSDGDPQERAGRWSSTSEAHRLVRGISKRLAGHRQFGAVSRSKANHLRSGQVTPVEERDPDTYVSPPEQYRGGVLSSLLKLYAVNEAAHTYGHRHPRNESNSHNSGSGTGGTHTPSPPESPGYLTPKQHYKSRKWYSNSSATASTSSLAGLIGASSAMLATPAAGAAGGVLLANPPRPKKYPLHSAGGVQGAFNRMTRPRLEEEIKVTVHIAETLSRHRYLRKLCRALMSYGAPTHRLEGQCQTPRICSVG